MRVCGARPGGFLDQAGRQAGRPSLWTCPGQRGRMHAGARTRARVCRMSVPAALHASQPAPYWWLAVHGQVAGAPLPVTHLVLLIVFFSSRSNETTVRVLESTQKPPTTPKLLPELRVITCLPVTCEVFR